MKASELMINDWVLVDGKPQQVREILHHGINPTYYRMSDEIEGYTHEEKLEPIPLTREVFERNGFGHLAFESDSWHCSDMVENVCFYINDLYCGIYGGGEDGIIGINVTYVHELQHFLRMLKIEKEIQL